MPRALPLPLMSARTAAVWQRLATDLKPRHLDSIVTRTISLDELPQAFEPYVKAQVTGRVVVRIE